MTGRSEGTGGLLLAVDTTGERCSACVFDAGSAKVLSAAEPEIGKGHAERLMGVLDEVLAGANASYRDLSRMAVAVGPGSFTGIRVGVSTVRGLALALGIPAIGVDVLEALAHPHLRDARPVLAVQDARRGEVYAALYRSDGSALRAPTALPPDGLAAFVEASQAGALSIVGSGARIAAERLPNARIVTDRAEALIESVARIAAARTPGGPVRPLYLRQADAKPSAAPRLVDAT